MTDLKRGSCLCGRVSFTVAAKLGAPDACHCVQCRKQSGHYFASANVPRAALVVTGDESLSWYRSSAKVRRGFSEKGDYYEIADGLRQSLRY